MTENTTTETVADDVATDVDTALEQAPEQPDQASEVEPEQPSDNPAREAAKYRRQLRDVEAERDALAGRVEALQLASVEAHLRGTGVRPDALWAADTQIADMLDDDGLVDRAKVHATAQDVRKRFGIPGSNYVPSEGRVSRGPKTSGDFASAFRDNG